MQAVSVMSGRPFPGAAGKERAFFLTPKLWIMYELPKDLMKDYRENGSQSRFSGELPPSERPKMEKEIMLNESQWELLSTLLDEEETRLKKRLAKLDYRSKSLEPVTERLRQVQAITYRIADQTI